MLPDPVRGIVLHFKAELGADVKGVSKHIPHDVLVRLPWVRVRRIGGGDVHPRFASRPTVDIEGWAATDDGAENLVGRCAGLLFEARRQQTPLVGGRINFIETLTGPTEVRTPEQSPSVYRYVGTYGLVFRRT